MLSKFIAIGAVVAGSACTPAGEALPPMPPPWDPGPTSAAPPAEETGTTVAPAAAEEIRNIIFMLADGAGIAYWSAVTHARAQPAFATMPVVALVGTSTARHRVPDSAGTASAYATGERVTNRVISMVGCPQPEPRDPVAAPPPGCEPAVSWFELAAETGLARGLVTTTRVVDASPAAFVAHSPSRYWYAEIAEQFAAADLDVMLGGGRAYFAAATRPDGEDLLGRLCARGDCVFTAEGLRAYEPSDRPLVGLFAEDDMGSVAARSVSLGAMTAAALARLNRDPEGFVALIETEGTDNAGHANEPLDSVATEMLAFDDAVGVALRFAEENPGTLVIVTADHETGGLALGEIPTSPDSLVAQYTTRGHTASMVPLFAFGPGAQRFAGVHRIEEIGQVLKELVAGM